MMDRRDHVFENRSFDSRKKACMPREVRSVRFSCSLLRAASCFCDFWVMVSGERVTWKLAEVGRRARLQVAIGGSEYVWTVVDSIGRLARSK